MTMKRWWRFRAMPSLWAEFLKGKYCSRIHSVARKTAPANSSAWRQLMKIKAKLEGNIFWKINIGSSSFWWDNWTKKGHLAGMVQNYNRSGKLQVKEFLQQGEWNNSKLQQVLNQDLCEVVRSIPIGNNTINDTPIWSKSENGNFNNKSAWQIIKTSTPINLLLKNIWHKTLPFKISFLMWRLLKQKLPFDDSLEKFGLILVSRCKCCSNPQEETAKHLFLASETATELWNFFGQRLGITHDETTVGRMLMNWWKNTPKNAAQKMILQVTPVVICWILWKHHASCKYGTQKKMSVFQMKREVRWLIQAALNKSFPTIDWPDEWKDLCDLLEKLKHKRKVAVIKWERPSPGRLKINSDGSFKSDTCQAGIGWVLRDEQGEMVMAFAQSVVCDSNNMAEALAASHAIQWCLNMGHTNLEVDMDSLVVANMIKNKDFTNCRLRDTVQKIVEYGESAAVQINHCYRESNSLADCLAKEGAAQQGSKEFHFVNDLSSNAQAIYVADKNLLPNIRIRYEKSNFFVS